MKYAESTSVPVERSKGEMERILKAYGASRFAYMADDFHAVIGFSAHGMNVRFNLPFPDIKDFEKTPTGRARKTSSVPEAYEQEIRRRWRALSLVIKAKLEAVESGITEFESEFLAHIVLPGGETVGEAVVPKMKLAYQQGKPIALLPDHF